MLIAAAIGVHAQAVLRTFDQDKPGLAPAGFAFTMARQASPGRWLVRSDAGQQHLAHIADAASPAGLAIAVLAGASFPNVRASVRIRFSDGEFTGGLVWRYQNPQNFYAATLDLRTQEIALDRIVNGNRVRLEREGELELDPNAWHSIRIEHEGDRVRVSLGGIGVIRTRDRALAAAGQVGIWSGGNATTAFDDVRVDEGEGGDGRGNGNGNGERRRENPRR